MYWIVQKTLLSEYKAEWYAIYATSELAASELRRRVLGPSNHIRDWRTIEMPQLPVSILASYPSNKAYACGSYEYRHEMITC
jgi:hypothetical protein